LFEFENESQETKSGKIFAKETKVLSIYKAMEPNVKMKELSIEVFGTSKKRNEEVEERDFDIDQEGGDEDKVYNSIRKKKSLRHIKSAGERRKGNKNLENSH
jgi:hypothetical protein